MIATDSYTELLRKTKLCRVMTDDQIRRLREIVVGVEASPGTHLFDEGSPADHVWCVSYGTVDIQMHVPGYGSSKILELGTGDLID